MEIERKWLIDAAAVPYDLSKLNAYTLEQFYVSVFPTIRARNINGGEQYILTVKTHPDGLQHKGLQREEYEFPISEAEYKNLLQDAKGNIIRKTRYVVPKENGLTEEIDIFSGDLEGLAYLEIEFPDTKSAIDYPNPVWVRADVTYDVRYKNSSLALHGKP